MRLGLIVLAGSVAFSACSNTSSSTTTSAPASSTPPAASAGAKSVCPGFGVPQAAEMMGVPVSAVRETIGNITPKTLGCDYVAGDKRIGFSITEEDSVAAAKRVLDDAKETYQIALRVQEQARGKEFPEGAYSEILNIDDEVIWSVTNNTMLGRRRNVTFQVMFPSDKRGQAAVAKRISDGL